MSELMDPKSELMDPNELRAVARFVTDTSLEELTVYSEISFAPVIGNLYYFPRPAPEERAAEQGFRLLREDVEEVVAILYALAAARDYDRERRVPLALLARVEPYIEAYNAARKSKAEAE